MFCHLPLLFPLAGLVLFAFLPFPVALAIYLPFAALSSVFALKVLQAMRAPASTGQEGMRGLRGVVVTAQGMRGMVRVQGELWAATAPVPLAPGDPVAVVEVKGLTALVRPMR